MALPERKELPPDEIKIDAFIDKDKVFFVYCRDCKKALYCALEDTKITRRIAEVTMHKHAESFYREHRVITVEQGC